MKRLVLLLPLLLTDYVCAADITTEDPFQITCTWTRGEKSGDETYSIDPKLDIATLEVPQDDGEFEDIEYIVTRVTPRKIVLSTEWLTPVDNELDYYRDENVIDRSSGELIPLKYELGRDVNDSPLFFGWKGKQVDLDYEYECQKPTRPASL